MVRNVELMEEFSADRRGPTRAGMLAQARYSAYTGLLLKRPIYRNTGAAFAGLLPSLGRPVMLCRTCGALARKGAGGRACRGNLTYLVDG